MREYYSYWYSFFILFFIYIAPFIIIKLKNSHIRKIERQTEWKKKYFEKSLTELTGKIIEFPKSLTLEEQGQFILGYYHQVQKRYEKKEEE